MNKDIETIKEKLIESLDILSKSKKEDLQLVVGRSNAIAQLANTYIKTCNLVLRIQESKRKTKLEIEMIDNEK